MSVKVISLSTDKKTLAILDAYARDLGVSRADAVRAAARLLWPKIEAGRRVNQAAKNKPRTRR